MVIGDFRIFLNSKNTSLKISNQTKIKVQIWQKIIIFFQNLATFQKIRNIWKQDIPLYIFFADLGQTSHPKRTWIHILIDPWVHTYRHTYTYVYIHTYIVWG
jgi:hypothetical protein